MPRDNYEVHHLNLSGDIKLRGWYFKGAGIADDRGKTKRALVIMNNGGGSEITAIDNPKAPPYTVNAGLYALAKPDKITEEPDLRHWRGFIRDLHAAGFDVLITDRRGNGISGGRNGFNTAEQANDMFRELEQPYRRHVHGIMRAAGRAGATKCRTRSIIAAASSLALPQQHLPAHSLV